MATMRAIATWFNPRRRVIALLAIAWCAIVVVSAGDASTGNDTFAFPDLSGVLVVVLTAAAIGGLMTLIRMRPEIRSDFSRRPAKALKLLILLAIGMLVLATVFNREQASEEEELEEVAEEEIVAPLAPTGGPDDTGSVTTRTDAIVLAVLGGVALGVLVYTRRRLRPDPALDDDTQQSHAEELGLLIDAANESLQVEGDPRTVVLVAYANLENALAVRGQARHVAETPSQHMQRVFATVPPLTPPAVRLGQLYELARFSDHAIVESDRADAVAQLATARGLLSSWVGGDA